MVVPRAAAVRRRLCGALLRFPPHGVADPHRRPAPRPAACGGPRGSTLASLLKLPTDYGILAVSFLLLAWPGVFAWVYLFLAVANAGYTLLVLPVWMRRLRALDADLAR
ncbi:hypothetical protein [Tessaracoccus coleopterorum]|uniref:hypothetical protein n=1 Tax=Tessaracoccus coleopterorum TaxID=2714950 RepID=UPI001E65A177|nr:hypothetical protein [Tessaracoccus coleopterorum]